MIIGIAGGSASGKTSFTKKILNIIGGKYIVHVEQDLYYKDKYDMPKELIEIRNFDHPSALDIDLLVKHIKDLQDNRSIEQPIYDFTTDRRKKEKKVIHPKPIILIEGVLIFAIKELRELMDIKVFIHTDTDIRLIRRIRRDIDGRGRSIESILSQYETTVKPMHNQFVEPSMVHADMIFSGNNYNFVGLDLIITKIRSYIAKLKEYDENLESYKKGIKAVDIYR